MDLKNFIADEIGMMTPQEGKIFENICRLCEHFQIEHGETEELLRQALIQYKQQEYNLFERTVDSILKIFGLTTTPEHGNILKFESKINEAQISAPVHEIDDEVKKLLDDLENAQKELNFHRKETNRLSAELNAVNNKLASFISENTTREKDLISNLQRMIALRGRDNPPSEDEPLGRILENFNLTFIWDADNNPECFSSYIISDLTRTGIKQPAMLKNNKLVLNGLVYTLEGGNNL